MGVIGKVIAFKNHKNPQALRPMFKYIQENSIGTELVGVEIGTQCGVNAHSILSYVPRKKLYLVDPYIVYSEYVEWTKSKFWSKQDMNKIYEEAKQKLYFFKDKIQFIKKFSVNAVDDVPNNLDFVYIDGNHAYEYVKKDIEYWYPKVKPRGVIGGHDLDIQGVTRAFVEFAKGKRDIFVNMRVTDNNGYGHYVQPDWWVKK